MSEDRNPRRRPKKKTSSPLPIRGILGHWRVLLALLPLAIVASVTYGALRSSFLTVQEVRVEGTEVLEPAGLIAKSGLMGESMLRLPKAEARARLLEDPQLRSVSISRSWPRPVVFEVEERHPIAFWSINGLDYVVDIDGVVLTAGVPPGLSPRIVELGSDRVLGPGDRVHPDALALALHISQESLTLAGHAVAELTYRESIGITVVFSNGLRATFGDLRSYEYKLAVLSKLLDDLSAQGIVPRQVDLRFGARVTYE